MGDPFWPGAERAGDLFTGDAFVAAMVVVEAAWVDRQLVMPDVDLAVELDAESGGNAVIPLVAALREANPALADRIHVGLTSQDVVDTAMVLMLRDVVKAIRPVVRHQIDLVETLIDQFGATPILGRTLTQAAQPITFGHKLSAWRSGLIDGIVGLDALAFPVQKGGPVGVDRRGKNRLASTLGLDNNDAWHTSRGTITRAGDALVSLTDAFGHVARDVLELSRPEIGELAEGVGGGSSSMPYKHNPVLSVLIRRAALTAPMLGATLHLAAAEQVDERADGGWHAEWDTLRLLARRTAVAASQAADLLEDLQVHADRMADNLARWGPR